MAEPDPTSDTAPTPEPTAASEPAAAEETLSATTPSVTTEAGVEGVPPSPPRGHNDIVSPREGPGGVGVGVGSPAAPAGRESTDQETGEPTAAKEKPPAPIIIVKRRKVRGHEGQHSTAWKVAYADFATAMMAFFLVMWILSLDQDVRTGISEFFTEPGAFSLMTGKAITIGILPGSGGADINGSAAEKVAKVIERDRFNKARDQIVDVLASLATQDRTVRDLLKSVRVEITPEGLRIELVEAQKFGFFEVGGATPNAAAQRVLAIIAPKLSELANPIRIEGHTDARQFGSLAYGNWELSTERANAARRILRDAWVAESQIESVVGLADHHLAMPDDPYDVSNRRVSILVRYHSRDNALP